MTNREIGKRFGKRVLLDIAEELGISAKLDTHVYDLCDMLLDNLRGGLPEDEVSEELWDLMVAADFIDEDGNELLSGVDNPQDEQEESDEVDEKLPKCYGLADDADPACKRCALRKQCVAVRDANRPSCFGLLYDANDNDCKMCIHWMKCEDATTKQGESNDEAKSA